jgi:single-stranded-DNA-specific exonuclease
MARMVMQALAAPADRIESAAASSPEVRELAQALHLSRTIATHLHALGYRSLERAALFLDPKLAHLTPPHDMADRAVATDRIAHELGQAGRICVFGDYDCDGITSTALMTEVLRAMGGEVLPLLGSRFDGGYGLSGSAVERIGETGANLLICCDCGSSEHEQLAVLRSRGIDCIVIDHHVVPPEPLPVVAFLNPHRADCAFPYKNLATCGLALSISAALRTATGCVVDVRRWLDLVAIGTIADVAPLDGDNRALVRAGLSTLRAAQRPGIRALFAGAGIDTSSPFTSEDVAFRIAPRLNAPGRLGEPKAALDLLLATSEDEARSAAAVIEQLSAQRRAVQERMIAEAVAEIDGQGYAERPAILLGREGWNHGIVGIVAGRLASRYGKPVGRDRFYRRPWSRLVAWARWFTAS